jgi:hypothetical protein
MNKKTIALSVATLALAGFALAPSVLAYQGDPTIQGPNCTPERHEATTQAFENNDYDAWKEQMQGRGRVTQVVNESNFARFAQAHQLAQAGKTDEAKAIRTELGLGQGQKKGNGSASGRWNQ